MVMLSSWKRTSSASLQFIETHTHTHREEFNLLYSSTHTHTHTHADSIPQMLHSESGAYNPTRPSPTASTGGRGSMINTTPVNGTLASDGSRPTSSARQRMNQQQLLRYSVGGRASYVAGVRRSSSYALPTEAGMTDSVQSLTPLSSTNATPANTAAASIVPHDAGYEMELMATHPTTVSAASYTPPQDTALTVAGEDFVHEVLAMNTMAMELSYAALGSGAAAASPSTPAAAATTEEPMKILHEAFMRLDDSSAQDVPGPLLDQLKATTLNNMGVVECNRGQPRQALSHFEAARQLEENNNMASPSVALNTCAAYNALRMYDKATAAALEAIDMLRALEVQRQRSRRIAAAVARHGEASAAGPPKPRTNDGAVVGAELDDTLVLEAAAAPQIADSQNAALWGAAWNNLAVAQINTARESASKDTSEYTNTLTLFQNAMRATQELLGTQHPMSKAVVETFRSVRLALRNHGAFKQHRTLLRAPLPPVDPREQAWEEEQVEAAPGQTRHNALVKQRQQLTITFRGEVTGGQKLIERIDGTPYPGAASEAYKCRRGGSSGRANSNTRKGKRTPSLSSRSGKRHHRNNGALRGMPHIETLARASLVYGNPHPLLYTPPLPPPQPHEDDGGAHKDAVGPSTTKKRNSARHGCPSPSSLLPCRQPPPPTSSSSRTQQEPSSMLPPISHGRWRGGGYTSEPDDDEMRRTNETSVSSVFMHDPPLAPRRNEFPAGAAGAAQLQQPKMLLLASPSSARAPVAADELDGSHDDCLAATSAFAAAAHGGSNSARDARSPSTPHSGDEQPLHGEGAAGKDRDTSTHKDQPSHELFQGMWVTADAHYVHRGPLAFGRPVYYTISTTLDVDEDGVAGENRTGSSSGAAEDERVATSASASSSSPEPAKRVTLPTLTYSDSSSSSEDGTQCNLEAAEEEGGDNGVEM